MTIFATSHPNVRVGRLAATGVVSIPNTWKPSRNLKISSVVIPASISFSRADMLFKGPRLTVQVDMSTPQKIPLGVRKTTPADASNVIEMQSMPGIGG